MSSSSSYVSHGQMADLAEALESKKPTSALASGSSPGSGVGFRVQGFGFKLLGLRP